MTIREKDSAFTGSIPMLYEKLLVPMIFESYAADMVARLFAHRPSRVLEVAAGTGVVTRRMASELPPSATIVASDLNQAMVEMGSSLTAGRHVEWRQADAMQLPFADGSFDAIVCQFGVMFFPDKAKAFSQARRVLKPGGVFLFSVWDRIEENEFANVVEETLAGLFPQDPPRFLSRTPHGYFDHAAIARDVAAGGFPSPAQISTVTARSRAASASIPALAYCQGSPLRGEIEARDATRLDEATDRVKQALAQRFGQGAVDGKIRAHIVSVVA